MATQGIDYNMYMPRVLIAVKPITENKNATLIFDDGQCVLSSDELQKDQAVTIRIRNSEKRYCQGWYDIETHQNFPCENASIVDAKFGSCYVCRSRTDFNPGFYNSANISPKQAAYNARPHTVYIAYFGNELYKAGILSQSRGLDRIYEQGALYYAIVEQSKDAYDAHALEERLIKQGLRNSVTKSQKQTSYESLCRLDDVLSTRALKNKLASVGLASDLQVNTTIDTFFFGHRPVEPITTVEDSQVSGIMKGIVGNYLVVENHDRLFGIWLSKLLGYETEISEELVRIEAEPTQSSLF